MFLRDLEADAQAAGHAAIFVEYPKTSGDETKADEIEMNIRPYWLPIKKENILSWRTEVEGGIKVLTQVVLLEETMVPDGEYGEAKQTRYRVLYREGGTVGWRLLSVNKNREVVVEDEGVYPTQKFIPIAEIGSSGSKSLFVSDPPLLDLGYLNVAHYQQWSDYAYSIHKTNVPFLFGAGLVEARNPDGTPAGSFIAGPNTSIFTQDPNAKMEYVSHDGAALGASKQSLDDLKSDMGTLGLAMLAPSKRVAETADAKRLDKSTSDSSLSVSARALQDGVENALQFHANYMKLPSGGSITINRDFEGLLMESDVMTAYATLIKAGFPSMPVLVALQKGGRIADDADLEELEMQWLMGQALNEQVPPEPVDVEDEV